MISTFESLLPVFLLIALGLVLRARNVVPADMWRGLELLGYWVFFPALLGDTLIRSDIASLDLSGITITMVGTFTTMALGLLAARRVLMNVLVLDGPAYSSLFQGATRWNGFIALPILAKLYGDEGVALVAVIIGALVPPANIMAVAVVAQNAGSQKLTLRETAYVVFRNPFIWATAAGLLINLAGIPIYEPVMTSMSMLGGAAIASGLLMVGAGLSTSETIRPSAPVLTGTALKLLGTPLIVILWSSVTGVSGTAFVACMVCAAVPTAMSAYVLARQMGGDAPLIAATVMTQTIVSFFSIPLIIMLAQRLQ
ncbi:AEC family transporter [Aestuariivirga sp.]|uniref:AEC family transporter n=1 Tax=Aestuariivirga sp. TaxID=2650926 RepID=UPI003592F680